MKTLLKADGLYHESVKHNLKNTKLVKSRRDGSISYDGRISEKFNYFQESHWENLIYVESTNEVELKVGDLCLVNWGVNIVGEQMYEISRLTKIGRGGIHYFDDMAQCFNDEEVAQKVTKIIKASNSNLYHLVGNEREFIPSFDTKTMEQFCKEQNTTTV